jgi:hypothetical protein
MSSLTVKHKTNYKWETNLKNPWLTYLPWNLKPSISNLKNKNKILSYSLFSGKLKGYK